MNATLTALVNAIIAYLDSDVNITTAMAQAKEENPGSTDEEVKLASIIAVVPRELV